MTSDPPRRPRLPAPTLFLAVSLVAAAIPFLAVRFPPITDLPQQAAQVRLLLEALHDPSRGQCEIHWGAPQTLPYSFLGLAWAVFGPRHAGRVGMLMIVLLSVAATHWLAWRRGRSPEAATLAAVFVFSHVTYWGFYGFALGWPAFAVWIVACEHPPTRRAWTDALAIAGASLLLYGAHVLWLAAGGLWLVGVSLWQRLPWRRLAIRAVAMVPVLVLCWFWYPHINRGGFATLRAMWAWPWHQRLADFVLGGLYGPTEPVILGALLAWMALGLIQSRHQLRLAVDHRLLALALCFLGLGLALPDFYRNTILFGPRWLPPAAMLLLLAAPPPRLNLQLHRSAIASILAVFCLATTLAWMSFQRSELSGLPESLVQLPPAQRVLGLAFTRGSKIIKGSPFMQVFAYAQVVRAGDLSFSFAQMANSLVVCPRQQPWTRQLEWFPTRVRADDFQHFDYALVGGTEKRHELLAAVPYLEPKTASGRWRLYRVLVNVSAPLEGQRPSRGPAEPRHQTP